MSRRATKEQRDRENELAKIRYDSGYKEVHQRIYIRKKPMLDLKYETIIKPKLAETKEHRMELQRNRRKQKQEQRLALRASMSFSEYRNLLAEQRAEKEQKKVRRMQIFEEETINNLSKKEQQQLRYKMKKAIAKIQNMAETRIERLVEQLKKEAARDRRKLHKQVAASYRELKQEGEAVMHVSRWQAA